MDLQEQQLLIKLNLNSLNKNMDLPGIEPGAFRMQSERDTPTPQTQSYSLKLHLRIYEYQSS